MSDTVCPHERGLGPGKQGATIDDLFEVLSTARRRTVLKVLADRNSAVSVSALARAVAAREQDIGPEGLSKSAIEDVHVALHHVHLPKLDAAGLIEYDRHDRTVSTHDVFDGVPIDID